MIVVRIELHHSVTHRVTELGRMQITNDGMSELEGIGDYDVTVLAQGDHATSNRSPLRGRVLGYERLRTNIWKLVLYALKAVFNDHDNHNRGTIYVPPAVRSWRGTR